jgi:hypothetical protein
VAIPAENFAIRETISYRFNMMSFPSSYPFSPSVVPDKLFETPYIMVTMGIHSALAMSNSADPSLFHYVV